MTTAARAAGAPRAFLVVVAYLGFVSLALPDVAHGVAWPFVRDLFALPAERARPDHGRDGGGLLVSSFFAGRLLEGLRGWAGSCPGATGARRGRCAGSSAWRLAPSFPLFLACAPLVGLGSGASDAGLTTIRRSASPRAT